MMVIIYPGGADTFSTTAGRVYQRIDSRFDGGYTPQQRYEELRRKEAK